MKILSEQAEEWFRNQTRGYEWPAVLDELGRQARSEIKNHVPAAQLYSLLVLSAAQERDDILDDLAIRLGSPWIKTPTPAMKVLLRDILNAIGPSSMPTALQHYLPEPVTFTELLDECGTRAARSRSRRSSRHHTYES